MTLGIVALDVEAGTAVIANAGHLPPLIFAPGLPGVPATTALNTSPPIGVPVSGPRASTQLQLPHNVSLMLLTDGLEEERANDLDVRLAELTDRATELLADSDADLEAVADALVQPRVHRDDDVTVLLARLHSGPAAAADGSGGTRQGGALSDGASRSATTRLLQVQLEHGAGAAATARGLVRAAVLTEHWSAPADLIDAMLLVTSELVTNGLRHGEPPVQLTLDRRGGRLRLTVTDKGSNIPRPRVAGPEATGGRGLFLVSALSTAWKIEPQSSERNDAGQGTSVWAEFAL